MPDAASRRPVRPSMGFRGAPRTRARRTRTVIGSVRPVRRFYALRVVILRTSPRPEGRRSALPALSRPYEDVSLQPHTAASCPRLPEGNRDRLVPRCCLSWAFVPYDTIPGRWLRLMMRRIPPSPRAACEVWLPPSRPPPPALPAREAPERPWASPSKAFPSCTSGAPFGVPALLTLPTAPTLPKESGTGAAASRAFFP